jgi:type IV secretory pathway VirJ component
MTMSIFSEAQTTGTDQGLTQTTEGTNPLEVLVGEGKKFKTVEDLAKGKLEADRFISELQRQTAELQEELKKNLYEKEVLASLQAKATATGDVSNAGQKTTSTTEGETKPKPGEADIESLIEKTIQERERKNIASQNLSAVESHLTEAYGTEAQKVVNQKAKELGLTVQRMQELAAESPTAFLSLLGEKPKQPLTIKDGSVRTESLGLQGATRDWAYYQKLRRENPKLYFTPATQQQLMKDKIAAGDKFGN